MTPFSRSHHFELLPTAYPQKELECDAVERAAEERKKAEGEMRMWQAAAEKAAAEKKQVKGALDLSQTFHSLS